MEVRIIVESSRTVTVEQAAKMLGIGRSLAYELARCGKLPALRLGHRLVVSRAQLLKMLEEREGQAVEV